MQPQKRKQGNQEEIKKKKLKLEADIAVLVKDADELAMQAEKESNILLIVKSNALRKASEEKKAQLREIKDF